MTKNGKKYVVTVSEMDGALNNKLFETMASKGDITSISVTEIAEQKITINGHAIANIETDDKSFTLEYFNTLEYGIVHCGGSTCFADSYADYAEYTNEFIVSKIKCKNGGTAYKAVPVMKESTPTSKVEELPFN